MAVQVAERDLYLAWSLKRSKAVNSSKRVVGVIGKGHMQVGLLHTPSGGCGNVAVRCLKALAFMCFLEEAKYPAVICIHPWILGW